MTRAHLVCRECAWEQLVDESDVVSSIEAAAEREAASHDGDGHVVEWEVLG